MTNWKQAEASAATHFGVKRNIARGANFAIEDTDFDVVDEESWDYKCLIADVKHGKNNACVKCWDLVRKHVAWDDRLTPVVYATTGARTYLMTKLKYVTPQLLTDIDLRNGYANSWVNPAVNYWPLHVKLREGTVFLDEWFNKMFETYRPKKAEEFNKARWEINPIMVVRAFNAKDMVFIVEMA